MHRRLLPLLAITSALILGLPATAFAAWEGINYGTPSTPAAGQTDFGSFNLNSHGFGGGNGAVDDAYVEDLSGDSQRVGFQWRQGNGRAGMCVDKNGNDSQVKCDYNWTEGSSFEYRVGLCDGSVDPCGQPGSGGQGWASWSNWASATI